MSRVFRIELRRSAAIGSAVAVAAVGTVLLYFAGADGFTTGWMQLAMTQRLFLAVLWPLALAAGAWQGRREQRSNVGELFASTPRPRLQQSVPTLGAMAVAVLCGYLVMGVAGAVSIIATAEYLPVSVFVVTAVGVLALIAAAWVGLAVGRLLPWPVTPPALGVAGLALLLLLPAATRPRGWLALVFSPIYEMNMPDAYQTVPGRASAAQALWLTAVAVAGVMLFASRRRPVRVAALLPLVLGAALAITVMPHRDRVVHAAIDPVAQELVCAEDEPRVCLSRVHSGRLAEMLPPAREGLALLTKLPDAPTRVHEDTTTYVPLRYAPWDPGAVLVRIEVGSDNHVGEYGEIVADVVAGAFDTRPDCENQVDPADRLAAAHWLTGTEPIPGDFLDPADLATAVERWRALRELPAAEAAERVAALRRAAVACSAADGLLTRGTP